MDTIVQVDTTNMKYMPYKRYANPTGEGKDKVTVGPAFQEYSFSGERKIRIRL